ncbi:unnamed protein product, partial [Lymnaea stagnalis]
EAYIFNGEGVYRILEINTQDVNFKMQGRTCRAVGRSGNLTDATIWCGLAMMSTNNDTMRISMNDNGTTQPRRSIALFLQQILHTPL